MANCVKTMGNVRKKGELSKGYYYQKGKQKDTYQKEKMTLIK